MANIIPDQRTQSLLEEADKDPLLLAGEVARVFRVDAKTVTRWAAAGRLRTVRTPGGHRRYRESDVRALLAKETAEDSQDAQVPA